MTRDDHSAEPPRPPTEEADLSNRKVLAVAEKYPDRPGLEPEPWRY